MTKTLKLPDRIMQQIQAHCEAEDIAMALIGSDAAGVCIIMFGNRNLGPDQASIIAADMLLQGVISNAFHQDNEEKLEQEKRPIPKAKVN